MKKINGFFIILFLCLLVICSYHSLLKGFFEQDEWVVFSETYLFFNLPLLGEFSKLFYVPGILGHFIPLSNIYSLLLFQLFHLHFSYYAIHSIFIHILNVLCVGWIAKKIFKNNFIAISSS